ncbi:MAG TPA: hypothetical protein VFU49_24600 [Ktedonobacteraceae bacterium]|nr:hypothetical protein [Ktedonobacteraceae bacterium]
MDSIVLQSSMLLLYDRRSAFERISEKHATIVYWSLLDYTAG